MNTCMHAWSTRRIFISFNSTAFFADFATWLCTLVRSRIHIFSKLGSVLKCKLRTIYTCDCNVDWTDWGVLQDDDAKITANFCRYYTTHIFYLSGRRCTHEIIFSLHLSIHSKKRAAFLSVITSQSLQWWF